MTRSAWSRYCWRMARAYHHGDLRRHVLDIAVTLLGGEGPDAVSLREVARRAEVSHAAPAHHFGSRQGLFTAVAAEGFRLLADEMRASIEEQRFDLTAVAYVGWAVKHPGHFSVMFRTDLLDGSDDELVAAQAETSDMLTSGVAMVPDSVLTTDRDAARKAAWALVHGLASLVIGGQIEEEDAERLTLQCARQLFPLR
ncbi:TetR family transcriptional regulator [Propioniferax innocua]|uniref:TetR family transcriptional regulator n=2 Tax=Propioniferax innocua TaxID=1753 RepID=A0A542ZBX1_9ACTN|nr:TetR family transcriptional regulator [Propioniferax innocua]